MQIYTFIVNSTVRNAIFEAFEPLEGKFMLENIFLAMFFMQVIEKTVFLHWFLMINMNSALPKVVFSR